MPKGISSERQNFTARWSIWNPITTRRCFTWHCFRSRTVDPTTRANGVTAPSELNKGPNREQLLEDDRFVGRQLLPRIEERLSLPKLPRLLRRRCPDARPAVA